MNFKKRETFYIKDEDKWEKDEMRLNKIKEKGFHVIKIWENDWNNFAQNKTHRLRIEYNDQEYHIRELPDIISKVVTRL